MRLMLSCKFVANLSQAITGYSWCVGSAFAGNLSQEKPGYECSCCVCSALVVNLSQGSRAIFLKLALRSLRI